MKTLFAVALVVSFAPLALPANATGTLRDAVERAWARQPAARAQPARSAEFADQSGGPATSLPGRDQCEDRRASRQKYLIRT